MDTQGTAISADTAQTEPAEPIAPITFHGRTIQTRLPDEGQIAVIARLASTQMDGITADRARALMNRVANIFIGLMVDPEDWEWIEDGMAVRKFTWDEVLGIFSLIAEAHGLVNRADRRAAKKSGGKSSGKVRRG